MNLATSVTARDLQHGYGEGFARTPVLHGLSLDFRAGELSLMMGASGSGKSTLLAILGGLLRPQSGTVELLGTAIWQLSARDLERFRFHNCGYIFQGFNLFPALSAVEQVALPLLFGGERESQSLKRARESLDEVGLTARMTLRPAQLSGGEKQRVAIARALAGSPKLLFADEPTSALDSSNGEIVIALLQKIAREHGATVITVTHDPHLGKHAERIIHLQDGRIADDALPVRASRAAALISLPLTPPEPLS